MSVLALHTLDIIWVYGPIKGVDIAKKLGVTKGAVSKVALKLLTDNFIQKEKRLDNKKEIYFSATTDGLTLAKAHHQMHQELARKGMELMQNYSNADLDLIAGFLEKMSLLTDHDQAE
jgi:DNA-binding MarR family transcriptional regulator